MARSTNKGAFNPQYPQKYNGEYPIIYRSSWELEFMRYCDVHPGVLEWASEPIKIPYKNPLKGSQTVYIPDFLVTYMSSGGGTSTKLIEIKPLHEASAAHARSSVDVAIRAKNEAKWGAATQWAARRGIDFIVLTEAELYSNHANRKGRAHPIKAIGKEQVRSNKPSSMGKTKKQTAANLGTASRATRSQSKARLGNTISRVGKVQKAKRSTKR
jgi:Straboviridae/Kyanoviridae head completion nuclease